MSYQEVDQLHRSTNKPKEEGVFIQQQTQVYFRDKLINNNTNEVNINFDYQAFSNINQRINKRTQPTIQILFQSLLLKKLDYINL